jgi:hypothetical protein
LVCDKFKDIVGSFLRFKLIMAFGVFRKRIMLSNMIRIINGITICERDNKLGVDENL